MHLLPKPQDYLLNILSALKHKDCISLKYCLWHNKVEPIQGVFQILDSQPSCYFCNVVSNDFNVEIFNGEMRTFVTFSEQ